MGIVVDGDVGHGAHRTVWDLRDPVCQAHLMNLANATNAEPDALADRSGPSAALIMARQIGALMAILPVVGLLLVVVADLVPTQQVVDHLVEGVESGELTANQYHQSAFGNQVDEFTDCVAVTIGLGNRPGVNPVESAIRSPTLGSCATTTNNLQSYVNGAGLERQYDYFRYWHGYAIFTRPLIAGFGLGAARLVAFVALLSLTSGLAWSVARRHRVITSAALLAPFVLTTDFADLGAGTSHVYGAIAVIGSSWLAYELVARNSSVGRVAAASMIAGGIVVYADLLTMPPGGWALCSALVGLAVASRHAGRDLADRIGASALFWLFGYSWMWMCKWFMAGVVVGFDRVSDDITSQASLRIDGDHADVDQRWLAAINKNVDLWWAMPLTKVVVLALALAVLVVVRQRMANAPSELRWSDRLLIATPAALPLIWYELLRNHSQVHAWFTYRSVAIAVGIVAAAFVAQLTTDDAAVPAAPDRRRDREPAGTSAS